MRNTFKIHWEQFQTKIEIALNFMYEIPLKIKVIETMGIWTLVIDVEKIKLCWPLKFNALANVSLKVFCVFFFFVKVRKVVKGPSFLETFLFLENFNKDFFYRFIGSFFQNRLPVSEKTIGIDYTHGV